MEVVATDNKDDENDNGMVFDIKDNYGTISRTLLMWITSISMMSTLDIHPHYSQYGRKRRQEG